MSAGGRIRRFHRGGDGLAPCRSLIRVRNVHPTCILVLSLLAPGCLYPPARYVEARRASERPAAAAEKNAGDVPAPAKPTGPLISDGTTPFVMNLQPGGGWFAFHDPTPSGVMTPPTIDAFADAMKKDGGVIHTTGRGFIDWGGGIGFNFQGAGALTPIDASDWKGITFKASGQSAMHVGLATMATMPEFNMCKKCYDHFAVDIYLTSTPTVYTFTWADLRPGGWGTKVPLDAKTIVGLNFTSKGGVPWDFTLDDLKFIR
jgi:hypothetical protein